MAFVYHQIFCDESGKHQQDPLVAFAGVCATAERLSAFDSAWRTLLRAYELPSLHMARVSRLVEDHGYRLRKGQTIKERSEALFPFADCINKHLEMGAIQAWDVRGFNHLSRAVLQTLGGSQDPYFLAFVRGLAWIVDKIDEDDRISVICDDDPYTAWDCYNHYRSLGKADVNVQKKAVAFSFANDKHFPALQAADMVAFLARHEADEIFNQRANIWRGLYDRLVTEPQPPYGIMRWFHMYADEDMLVEFAREAQAAAEKAINERQKNLDRIRKIRQDNETTTEGSPQPDQGQAGRGEGSKKEVIQEEE